MGESDPDRQSPLPADGGVAGTRLRAEASPRGAGGVLLRVLQALTLVLLVGLSCARSSAHPDLSLRPEAARAAVGDFGRVLLALLSLLFLVGVIAVVRMARRRARDNDGQTRRHPVPWWVQALRVLSALAIPLLLWVLLVGLGHRAHTLPRPTLAPPTPTPTPTTVPPRQPPDPAVHSGALIALGVVVALAAIVAATVLAVRRRRRPDPQPVGGGESTDEVRAVVELSIDEVQSEVDPRRAVIKAYARMEQALAGRGVARRPDETPLEYLARTLASLQIPRGAVERLTELFHWAKFSGHQVDPAMKTRAIATLVLLRDELDAQRKAAT
jgi:hypothetical protein